MSSPRPERPERLAAPILLISLSLVLFELVLTRLFGIVLFSSFAHLALGLAMLGISAGALLQHLWPSLVPDEGLAGRLGWLALAQGVTTLLATVCVLTFPLTTQFETPPEVYYERAVVAWQLLESGWFIALLPLLTLPFTISGLAFAGVFQRRKEHIGRLYGADLLGGAVAAVAFLPLLELVPGPDTAFFILAVSALAAALAFRNAGSSRLAWSAGLLAALGLIISCVSSAGHPMLNVRHAAGYSEENVIWARWTPITRIALHEGERGIYAVLDNSSASRVVRDETERRQTAREPNRSLVYRLHEPGARIAILAASAGPEVASAQRHGHSDIDAIDIARVGEVVRERYPDAPANPYTDPGVRLVVADARSAILHAHEPYDIIQMVHANLHSSAGLLANAWSPALLETEEAFGTYRLCLQYVADHWYMHRGQLADARRAAGLERMWV